MCLSLEPVQLGRNFKGFKYTELYKWPAPRLSRTYWVRSGRLHLLLLMWSEALCLARAEARAWPSVAAAAAATLGWEGMGCALCLGYSRWAVRVGTKQNTQKEKKKQIPTISGFWRRNMHWSTFLCQSTEYSSYLNSCIRAYGLKNRWVVLKAFHTSMVLGTCAQRSLDFSLELFWPSLHPASVKWPVNLCLECLTFYELPPSSSFPRVLFISYVSAFHHIYFYRYI